ncbi:HEAT repeat domain-containing protein [Microcoleus sp. bin38.metabat.b11b12b14.051]|uniref:HEAT repeat domain-containing protein n=1 Tax=Microcoleus sp. bin38.metabat.b11b12b14.051 TaxID=2742709 RepID=UPI0025F2AF2C|nr:HEAT repeat domain-containing protein [Microcoleus sp. bin38.metabat.b11b12b14.051]
MAITPENQQAIVQILCKLLRDSKEPIIRAKAALSLGKLGIESAIPDLSQAASTDPDIQVCLSAIDALLLIAKPELIEIMTEPSKNQPTFHINQVGNINTGDVKIERDMVGIQYNYTFPEPKQAEAVGQVSEVIQDIRQQNPQASDIQIVDIIEGELATMHQNDPQKWQGWIDLLSVVFAGGVEAIKIIAPALGIPIEIARRLYEIYDRNRNQLPGN